MQNNKFDSLCNKILFNINESSDEFSFWKEFSTLPVYEELRKRLTLCYQRSGMNTDNPSYYEMYEELRDALEGLPSDQQKLCASVLRQISDEETEASNVSREQPDVIPPRQ